MAARRYAFSNLVMWSQSGDEVTLMLMRNLKRVVFRARTRVAAKKIVQKLHQVTEEAQAEFTRKEAFWGASHGTVADLERIKNLEKMWRGGHSDDEDSDYEDSDDDGREMSEDEFRIFFVKQSHLKPREEDRPIDEVVILKISFHAVELLRKDSGDLLQKFEWSELVLWRSDGHAVVLVRSTTNRQVTLMSDVADDVIGCLTKTAQAIHASYGKSTHTVSNKVLPEKAFDFRKELFRFKPAKVEADESWKNGGSGKGKWKEISNAFFGTASLYESIQTRHQLKAIVSVVDTEDTGIITIQQLGQLMKSLNIVSPETGEEFTRAELELVMIDMEATEHSGQLEVTFDEFVAWVLNSSTGALSSEVLRMRVKHRQKEVVAM